MVPFLHLFDVLVRGDSMFKSINSQQETVTIYFEGKKLRVKSNHNVAAALLEAGISNFRETIVNNENRGPYCMMGLCFYCLINIDGADNQQSCIIEVSDGMKVKRQIINRDQTR